MGTQRQKPEEDEPAGAPDWMMTFCDCMTLLLTFFVMLLSFATFHKTTLPQLGRSFARALPAIGLSARERQDSLFKQYDADEQTQQVEGTETRTQARTQSTNFMQEKRPLDFRNLKVFTIESGRFFWGRGAAISDEGRQVLDALAKFLANQTGRIVISENGPEGNPELGLSRSTAVMNYLTERHGLSKKRFNLSAATTMRQPPDQRQLEITLLDRSVYE